MSITEDNLLVHLPGEVSIYKSRGVCRTTTGFQELALCLGIAKHAKGAIGKVEPEGRTSLINLYGKQL
jgi:hypothetical protein